ncbi:MAG: hypothetical protein ACE5J4_02165 [Candidatus Aenigmatarchaeota archaeon]
MEDAFFDEELTKNTRLITCPSCDSEFRVKVEDNETVCDGCGEQFLLEFEGSYPEEFVWHPSEEY